MSFSQFFGFDVGYMITVREIKVKKCFYLVL